ncbi:MAG: hypothetical protein AAFN11_07945 [Chloroflexota bacterium]
MSDSDTTMYAIRVQGHLSPLWTDSFEGLTITLEEDGTTCLTGSLVDQAALHGVIKRIRDLGLTLIEIKQLPDSN